MKGPWALHPLAMVGDYLAGSEVDCRKSVLGCRVDGSL